MRETLCAGFPAAISSAVGEAQADPPVGADTAPRQDDRFVKGMTYPFGYFPSHFLRNFINTIDAVEMSETARRWPMSGRGTLEWTPSTARSTRGDPVASRSKRWRREQAAEVLRRLGASYPDAHIVLRYANEWELTRGGGPLCPIDRQDGQPGHRRPVPEVPHARGLRRRRSSRVRAGHTTPPGSSATRPSTSSGRLRRCWPTSAGRCRGPWPSCSPSRGWLGRRPTSSWPTHIRRRMRPTRTPASPWIPTSSG